MCHDMNLTRVHFFKIKKITKSQNHKMTCDGCYSHPANYFTLLAKNTKLNKIDEYYDQIEKENKSMTKLKKPNENYDQTII